VPFDCVLWRVVRGPRQRKSFATLSIQAALITCQKTRDFSWLRLLFLGSIASFNKELSGGGYGPVVTSGQILTGVDARAAIGITSFAEGITCIAAVLTYTLSGKSVDWLLALALAIGVALSTPV